MKTYPKIANVPLSELEGKHVIAFNKLDGSNIRAEWSSKKGFYKFGSRKHLIDDKDHQFGEAVELIQQVDAFDKIFKGRKIERAICFFEFWGDSSAFGSHYDEEHRVTLIDTSTYKKGIISPDDFIEWFGDDVSIPDILYRGEIDEEFYSSVKDGTLKGIGSEGVVCKAGFEQTLGGPWMTKIKCQSWFDRLKEHCNGDDNKFKELA